MVFHPWFEHYDSNWKDWGSEDIVPKIRAMNWQNSKTSSNFFPRRKGASLAMLLAPNRHFQKIMIHYIIWFPIVGLKFAVTGYPFFAMVSVPSVRLVCTCRHDAGQQLAYWSWWYKLERCIEEHWHHERLGEICRPQKSDKVCQNLSFARKGNNNFILCEFPALHIMHILETWEYWASRMLPHFEAEA